MNTLKFNQTIEMDDNTRHKATSLNVDTVVTEGGLGVDFSTEAFTTFVAHVVEAFRAPADSALGRSLQDGLDQVFRRGKETTESPSGALFALRKGFEEALNILAVNHLAHNSGLTSTEALAWSLRERFFTDWAKAYLDVCESAQVAPPLWTFVETRWLIELRTRWKKRRSMTPEIGVLFVHGMGIQRAGDTLEKFSRPLVNWFGDDAYVRDTTLKGNDQTPAHGYVDFPEQDACWLMAESCWAEEFSPPALPQLASWLITVGPALAVAHLGRWTFYRLHTAVLWLRAVRRRPWLWIPLSPAFLLLSIVILAGILVASFLVTVGLPAVSLTLELISFLPSLRAKGGIGRVLGFLRSVIGDSLAFTDNPMARSAILHRVRRDLEWLSGRVAKVVVVAHSQGAAIAHHVLRTEVPDNVALLVTIGSGLGKLERARTRAWTVVQRSVGWVVASMPVFVWLTPRLAEVFGLWVTNVWILYGTVYTTALLAGLRTARRELSLAPLPWIDYYASHDPVPNGPTTRHPQEAWVECRKVSNYASLWRDHTTYFENEDEFVPSVLRDISLRVGSKVLPADLTESAKRSARARTARVRSLALFRTAVAFLFLGGGVLALESLPAFATSAALAESNALGTHFLQFSLDRFHGILRTAAVPTEWAHTLGYGLVGWLLYGFILLPFVVLGNWAWRCWNRLAMGSPENPWTFSLFDDIPFSVGPRYPFLAYLALLLIGFGGTAALLAFGLSGWRAHLATSFCVFLIGWPLASLFPATRWATGISYRLLLVVATAGAAWVAFRTVASQSLYRAYGDLGTAAVWIYHRVGDQPEAFAPIALVLAVPLGFWIIFALSQNKRKS